jgi:hypothetical protein
VLSPHCSGTEGSNRQLLKNMLYELLVRRGRGIRFPLVCRPGSAFYHLPRISGQAILNESVQQGAYRRPLAGGQ